MENPKEEPKQTDEKGRPMTYWGGLEELKQETLEEAAKKYCLINNISTDQMIVKNDRSCEFETPITMFTHGAKWQEERMYSEEDMEKAFTNGLNRSFDSDFDRWFEQFKNK
jgi:hypothetical protein